MRIRANEPISGQDFLNNAIEIPVGAEGFIVSRDLHDKHVLRAEFLGYGSAILRTSDLRLRSVEWLHEDAPVLAASSFD